MGQAAVDLPNPIESPPPAAASTDDLLAQLAGQEIERMMGDNDAPPPSATPSNSNAPVLPATPVQPNSTTSQTITPSETDFDAVFAKLNSPPAPGGSGSAELPKPSSDALKDASHQPAPGTSEASAADALAREILEDEALTAMAQSGLRSASATSTQPPHEPSARSASQSQSTPLLLRLLAWINWPMEACSDQVRDLTGKIAIVTAVNALAVLAYVWFIRHH